VHAVGRCLHAFMYAIMKPFHCSKRWLSDARVRGQVCATGSGRRSRDCSLRMRMWEVQSMLQRQRAGV
jgi:hypothetical protein